MTGRSLLPWLVVALFVAIAVVAFRTDLAKIDPRALWVTRDALLVAAALSLLNYLLRTLRWALYLRHFGHRLPLGYLCLSYLAGFAFTLSPGKVGELARGYWYGAIGVPFSQTSAAFLVERVLDVLVMGLLALVGIAAIGDYALPVWLMLALVALVLGALALTTPALRSKLCRALEERVAPGSEWRRLPLRVMARIPVSVRQRLGGVATAWSGARALMRPGMLALGLGLGLIAWGAEGVGLQWIARIAPDVSLALPSAIGIYAAAIIVGALSFLPGGLGTTEAVMAALLVANGFAIGDAVLIALACRLLTLWFAVAIGWLAVLLLRRHPIRHAALARAAQ